MARITNLWIIEIRHVCSVGYPSERFVFSAVMFIQWFHMWILYSAWTNNIVRDWDVFIKYRRVSRETRWIYIGKNSRVSSWFIILDLWDNNFVLSFTRDCVCKVNGWHTRLGHIRHHKMQWLFHIPQQNNVVERHNRMLVDMVWSMMTRTQLRISF